MARFRHLILRNTAETESYTATGGGSGTFRTPPRDGRDVHGSRLVSQAREAEEEATAAQSHLETKPLGITLEFQSDAGFTLKLESLERRQSGIELLNVRNEGDVMLATVFVPDGKMQILVRMFERYVNEDTERGRPKNQDLAESISAIRRAALRSFWTDAASFPDTDELVWWEIWLRDEGEQSGIVEAFRGEAQRVGIEIGPRLVRFPERLVLLGKATVVQWSEFERLFDVLAELRRAKRVPTEFVELTPSEQADVIEAALQRIRPPAVDAPSVCLLDTGVNWGHPLIQIALSEDHLLATDPTWSPADQRGHGTEMAGLALYGCLTGLFSESTEWVLRHRLESVKILPDHGANDPEHYGAVSAEAVARAEVASPTRNRAICMAVTADSRDEGLPSSWSAALDQVCSGALDSSRRLMFVSAGNTPLDTRHAYPDRNHLEGVEDPAQAWNVVTVGAYTERCDIRTEEYRDWNPVAGPGRLCPSSRTSLIWEQREWPLKPDVVMEGGNSAINPATGRADFVDDLALLTTRVSPTGALLTTTGETSAATAQAARFAAIIYSQYPNLWPETVRGLLVHSARWSDAMCAEFPREQRHQRLRCYGYGVPDLERALWSLSNAATLVVQESLQPYDRVDGRMRTKDMHLHSLPWPVQVLQDLGEHEIRMRVTLSYFIEPSPGRRGWTYKHRYQSHGLRFDVKRPTENLESLRRRLTREAWDDPDERPDSVAEERNWELGERLRTRGSIHSDTWQGTASELAACGIVAVFPVTGWWRERSHLDRWSRSARYSLVISIETEATDVDLYTPIANQIAIEPEIET